MSNIAGKIWGSTELILANSSCEFHRIDYKKGGVCSKHKHRYKWNGFYCMSGKLKIRIWQQAYDLVDETILNDPEDLREWCKERISRWKIPRYIFFTDSFPVTPSGKIQKYKLQEKYIKDLSMS